MNSITQLSQRERELFNANILLKLYTYGIIILHVDNSCMIKFCLWSVSYPLMTRGWNAAVHCIEPKLPPHSVRCCGTDDKDGMLQFTVGLKLKLLLTQSDAVGLQVDH